MANGVLVPSLRDQENKRIQKTPLDPSVPALPLQSGCGFVHGRLKTSKMAKIRLSISQNAAKRYKSNPWDFFPWSRSQFPLKKNSLKQHLFFYYIVQCGAQIYINYNPETVINYQIHVIDWDRTIMSHAMHNRPDITIYDEGKRKIRLIDMVGNIKP